MDVFSGVRIVRSHASIGVVECHANMDVVIGVRIVLCCPLIHNSTFLASYFVPNSHCCHAVVIHPTFTCSHFSPVLHRIPSAFEVWYLHCGVPLCVCCAPLCVLWCVPLCVCVVVSTFCVCCAPLCVSWCAPLCVCCGVHLCVCVLWCAPHETLHEGWARLDHGETRKASCPSVQKLWQI